MSISSQAAEIPVKSEIDPVTIELIAGLPKPPFIVDKNERGIQIELIREAFRYHNINVNFIHLPLGRAITSYHRLNADGVMTLPANFQHPTLHISAPYITYQNVAVTLAENDAVIDDVKDLARMNLVAFQNARRFLGEEYNDVVSFILDYREMPNQAKQVEMLFMRRAEVIVLDINIFKHIIRQSDDLSLKKPFKVHYVFKKRHYVAGFNDKNLQLIFDEGIVYLKESGVYQQILDKYLN